MNPKVLRHKALCDEINALYERKNHDYGDSFHDTFVEEGFAMPRIRLSDKFSRFKTLSKHAGTVANLLRRTTDSSDHKVLVQDQQVTDESLRDTLIDLANYAIMTVLEMDEAERTEKDPEYSVVKQQVAETGYLATYELLKDGAPTGQKINIPNDVLLKPISEEGLLDAKA